MPVRSCPFACRSGRPPAIPAPRTEPGSSPRQRLYNRHSQRSRARSRYPQAGFARKIHLDHRRGAKPGIVPGLPISVSWRCNHHLRKPVTSAAKLLSPAVDLAWADLRPARHFGDNRSRLQGLGDNRLLCSSVQRRRRSGPVITSTLAIAPPLTPVQAPSLALMLDYQPETVLRRKAALTGGKRGNHNVVFVATTQNYVYAFDGDDDQSSSGPLWRSSQLGLPVPRSDVVADTLIDPAIGIISTPVIDRSRGTIFVVAKSKRIDTIADQAELATDDIVTIQTEGNIPGRSWLNAITGNSTVTLEKQFGGDALSGT